MALVRPNTVNDKKNIWPNMDNLTQKKRRSGFQVGRLRRQAPWFAHGFENLEVYSDGLCLEVLTCIMYSNMYVVILVSSELVWSWVRLGDQVVTRFVSEKWKKRLWRSVDRL